MEEYNEKKPVTNAQDGVENVDKVLTLMERIKPFIDKHGLKGTFTSLLTLFVAGMIGYLALNPSIVFQKFQEYTTEMHEAGIKQRLEADPQIRLLLLEFRVGLNADRAYILEAHNGGSNLSRLPFLYADLTYMDPRNTYTYIETEYKNFSLSRYPWASNVIENGYWFGSIDDFKEIDTELYYRLEKENVMYMGMFVMYGKTGLPSACLGVIFKEGDNIPPTHQVILHMQKYAAQINAYLIGN